jgi:hypothetical protein
MPIATESSTRFDDLAVVDYLRANGGQERIYSMTPGPARASFRPEFRDMGRWVVFEFEIWKFHRTGLVCNSGAYQPQHPDWPAR